VQFKDRPLWRSLNWPNRISLMRILGVAPFVVLLLHQQQWPIARHLAMVLFLAMGLSDALDGYLARKRHLKTRLGMILDPLADKLLILCTVVLLASDWACVPDARLPDWVAVAVVGKEFWVVVGFVVVFLVTGQVKIHPTIAGKLCTMVQIVMVASVLAAPDINRIGWRAGSQLAAAMTWVVAAMCVFSVASYTRLGMTFMAESGEHGHGHGHAGVPGQGRNGKSAEGPAAAEKSKQE
jgi:CDP-diacylglycerol--glycerol-3-phosphate 3-phosphatidyltransferase